MKLWLLLLFLCSVGEKLIGSAMILILLNFINFLLLPPVKHCQYKRKTLQDWVNTSVVFTCHVINNLSDSVFRDIRIIKGKISVGNF